MLVLIAYSSSAHRNLDLLSNSRGTCCSAVAHGCAGSVLCRVCDPRQRLDVPLECRGVERPLQAERPWERPAAQRLVEASRLGVEVRSPAGQRASGIGDAGALDRRHTQQVMFGSSLPTPDASAFRA